MLRFLLKRESRERWCRERLREDGRVRDEAGRWPACWQYPNKGAGSVGSRQGKVRQGRAGQGRMGWGMVR